ncbi:MAG: SET domain-containing protein [Candidatus Micrarchaeales archaeon]
MIADLVEIKETGKYGKGLFATQFIPKGTIIDSYSLCKKCGTYSKEELAKLSKKEHNFVIHHEQKTKAGLRAKYCDERLSYTNHSCNSNILESDEGFDIAIKDIKKGEEVTEDYRRYGSKKTHFVGGCKCGGKNCIGRTAFMAPGSKKLQKFWNRKINAALRLIPSVKQPLKIRFLKEHPELNYLFKKNKQPILIGR